MAVMALVGIDAGGTSFKGLLVAHDGAILARHCEPTSSPEATFAGMAGWIARLGAQGHRIEAMGIASFGPIDRDPHSSEWGRIGVTTKQGWEGANPRAAMEAATGIPCALDTDVNGALLAEHRLGAGRGLRDVAYVTIGTGVGGSAIVDGRLVGAPQHGEFGHIGVRRKPEDMAAFAGACSFHGDCVEGLASAPAIRARWGCDPADLPDDHQAWDEVAGALAQLCRSIAFINAPQRIILGGGVMLRESLLARIRAGFAAVTNGYGPRAEMLDPQSYIVGAALGDDAGAMGGVVLARKLLSREVD
ncbi:MAG: ROK family protein [Erythrobacter sp.]